MTRKNTGKFMSATIHYHHSSLQQLLKFEKLRKGFNDLLRFYFICCDLLINLQVNFFGFAKPLMLLRVANWKIWLPNRPMP
jgi:hypothetical protein